MSTTKPASRLVNLMLPTADYEAYRRIARQRGRTFSGYVRDMLADEAKPLQLRESLRDFLRSGITEAILRLRDDTGGGMQPIAERLGLEQVPYDIAKAEDWDVWERNGAVLYLGAKEGDSERPRYYHHWVRQSEGMTREEAIRAYADKLTTAVIDNEPEHRHAVAIAELMGDKHYYSIVYPSLSKWRTFPTEYELDVAWRNNEGRNMDIIPHTDEDVLFHDWVRSWLAERWANRPAPNEDGTITLYPKQPQGVMVTQELRYFPNHTEEENLDLWAKALLRIFHIHGSGELLRFESWHLRTVDGGVTVVPLSVRND